LASSNSKGFAAFVADVRENLKVAVSTVFPKLNEIAAPDVRSSREKKTQAAIVTQIWQRWQQPAVTTSNGNCYNNDDSFKR